MVLTHELAHIVLGHKLNTKLAFNDRMFFPDERTFERMDFSRDKGEEEAADKKALDLINSSPYKDKMATPGLFLKAVQARAPQLKNLIRPHLGDSLLNGDAIRMSPLMTASPAFDLKKTDQVAALPLGGRVKVDPWTNRLELIKTKPVALNSPAEKMPFEVTPFFPFLTRQSTSAPATTSSAAPPPLTTPPVATSSATTAPATTPPVATAPATTTPAVTAPAPATTAPAPVAPAATPPATTPSTPDKAPPEKTAQTPSAQ
jgi:hypothetical protein